MTKPASSTPGAKALVFEVTLRGHEPEHIQADDFEVDADGCWFVDNPGTSASHVHAFVSHPCKVVQLRPGAK
jgi:hypothetical protein